MHRLFHSLVVCGAGLTLLQCGGKSREDSEEPHQAGSGGAAGSSSTGGKSSSGGNGGRMTGSGGSTDPNPTTGAGGSAGTGGTAGTGGVGGLPSGPSEQWTCHPDFTYCFDYTGQAATIESCVLDPKRPASQGDCPPDTVFACMAGALPDGTIVSFNCECVPALNVSEPCPCPSWEGSCAAPIPPLSCDGSVSVCPCAMTCILR